MELFVAESLDEAIPLDHPIRRTRDIFDQVLKEHVPGLEDRYSRTGQPSIPPEHLYRAWFLRILSGIRSDRTLCEQIAMNQAYRRLVGLAMARRCSTIPPFPKTSTAFWVSRPPRPSSPGS